MLFFSKEMMNYKKINEWFISNKLSLNVKKKKQILLVLPKLNINNSEIVRAESFKFLGVLLDKNLS